MDLKIGSIPVKVTGRFLLMALLLGLNERDPARLAVWVAVVLVSVTVHELGHALMGMAFGYRPAIVLHGMGGHTTFGEARWSSSTGRSILISLAGPFAGFALAAAVIGIQFAGFRPMNPVALTALRYLNWVNIGWGIFNLVPMLPLDGGNAFRSLTRAVSPAKGETIARVVSVIVAVAIGLWSLRGGQWWGIYLAALFGFQNVQALRQAGQVAVDRPLADAVERSYAAINRNDAKGALAELGPVLFQPGADPALRRAGVEVYVVALIKEGRRDEAVRRLERERDLFAESDLRRFAEMLRREGNGDLATRVEALVQKPVQIFPSN